MLVEDGRRLLISNLELDFIAHNQVAIDGIPLPLSRSGFELARLFPGEFASFPVATAARLSAAFPYVSPAVSLPTVPRRRVRRGLEGLSSPVQGVMSSRDAVSVFRNDEQLEQVIRLYDGGLERGFVRTEIFAYPGQASLSWYLSEHERAAISRSARELSGQLHDLRAFWRGRPSQVGLQVGVHIADRELLHWGER